MLPGPSIFMGSFIFIIYGYVLSTPDLPVLPYWTDLYTDTAGGPVLTSKLFTP